MVVTIFGGDLATGEIKVRNIPARTGNVVETHGAAGTIECAVRLPLSIPNPPEGTDGAVDIRSILLPTQSFLAWDEDGPIRNAGPIWSDSYEFDNANYTMRAAGLRSYWQWRYVLAALNDNNLDDLPTGKVTTLNGMSLRTIAKRLVQQAQAWTAGKVPLVLEADFPGDAMRTYLGSDLHVLDEKLSQLSEVINGPEIMFRPRYANAEKTHIEWVMETGDPLLVQPGADHKWDITGVPVPSVKGASITRDATTMLTDSFQVGSTPETEGLDDDGEPLMAKAVRKTWLTRPGAMRLQKSVDRSSVINRPVLQSYADKAVADGEQLSEVWKFSALKSSAPFVNEIRTGDYGKVSTKDDAAMGTGDHRMRIAEISSRLTDDWATITCQKRNVTL